MTAAAEIQVFGMVADRKAGDQRIAQRGECVEHYDIDVRSNPDEGGTIELIEEHENLTYQQMLEKVAELEMKYDLAAEEVWGF